MGRKGDAVTAREGSAQPSPVSPICPPQALLQLVQEKPFGEERGAISPKRGPYSLPFSGAGGKKRADGRYTSCYRRFPPICPPQALLQLVQEKNLWGGKRGDSAQKGGAYSLSSRTRVWETVFRGGEVCRLPLSLPLPPWTRGGGKTADARGQKKAVAGREMRRERSVCPSPAPR